MDTLRGSFDSPDYDDDREYDFADDESPREPPPSIGTDERRMQVRAYNHWAGLLDERSFPSIEDLHPENLPDFGPHSVLLDFTAGIENPAVQFLGDELARECGADGEIIEQLSDVPARSLLSRITDHYMQILANQAPIGFEAEFVNQRGVTILYRGILLPFSSDDDTIDFIFGVINWKELADQLTTDELMLEIDQALEPDADEFEDEPEEAREPDPVTDWADAPVAEVAPLPLARPGHAVAAEFPAPAFGAGSDRYEHDSVDGGRDDIDWGESLGSQVETDVPVEAAFHDLDDTAAATADEIGAVNLHDFLAAARQSAEAARSTEDRSRAALYSAVGRAYDFSCVAAQAPAEFDELVAESGLTVQDRAPMTPVVKLVFGADYDKTRLTEYAAVLSHAHRLGIARGALAAFLAQAEGGLKGVVKAERQLRREESGEEDEIESPREALARKLRAIAPLGFEDIDPEGAEFGVVVIRRLDNGEVVLLGEVSDDTALVERAARKLVA